MNSQVFREYDIRGIVERDFDDEFVSSSDAVTRRCCIARQEDNHARRDCRLSSDRLRDCCRGFASRGSTWLTWRGADAAALFFGAELEDGRRCDDHRSHNAAEYNGFKLGVGPTTIHGAEIQRLREIVERRDFTTSGRRRAVVSRGDSRLQRFHSLAVQVEARFSRWSSMAEMDAAV